ncbi:MULTISPECIES: hypothetical protein [Bradyrhizobium]|uniref:hypothetical protein n=1 Tax=Bradyrhizobium sp. USDA 241 TaxID=3377725 RepID=UPI000484B8AB|nr:hypothetical protein QIH91_17770 [Bradyrhizobium japonicum USDA 135]GLR99645.1 hypothetical protein GCM10007858_72920 [Bradyrhizobium liaoningense]
MDITSSGFYFPGRGQLDKVTEGFLTEFSGQFGIENLAEKDRFEHLAAWLTVRRHFSDSTFSPADLVTGSGGDTGIDAIAVIVNNNLARLIRERAPERLASVV